MKRRILAAALSAALVLSLAACGGGAGGSSSSNPGGSSSSQMDGSASDGSQSDTSQTDDSSADTSLPDSSGADASEPDADASGSTGGVASSATGTDVKLTLNRTNIELNKAGATFKLNYKADPEIDADPTYTSSDTKVATVDKNGTVKAVAPGKVTITVKCGGATATASVNCNWTENKPDTSKPADNKPADPPPAAKVDLSAFYSTITGKYEFPMPMLADDEILDNFYSGMTGISTEQRLIYVCGTSMNNGEFGLVQVKDSKDVDTVKGIFQARINYMVGDGNGPGGAYYPAAMDQWENNARVVANGSYVMMVVHENCDDIVKEFNALF